MCRQVRETQWERLAEETMDRLRDEQLALQSELLGALLDDNLKPRKMRFGMSEGMVMAAGPGGEEIYLLSPDSGAKPGQRIK